MQHGSLLVGVTPLRVPVTGVLNVGMQLTADPANTGNIFYGATGAVNGTAGSANCGDLLVPGDRQVVEASHFGSTDGVWVVSLDPAAQQALYWKAQ